MANMNNRIFEPRLGVFISYSRQDADIADALADALEGKGIVVKIDRRDLEFGERWQAELADLIRLSDTVVWLVSAHSVRSEWVNKWVTGEICCAAPKFSHILATNSRSTAVIYRHQASRLQAVNRRD